MTAGLVSRVRAALDDRERLARALGGEGWNAHDEAHGMRRVTVNYSTDCVVACTLAPRGEHIAANDPAAVLRLVAALREIVTMHEPTPDGDCSTCLESESDIYGRTYERSPCYHLRRLAHGLGIDTEETP